MPADWPSDRPADRLADRIERLLADDFSAERAELERDGFSERVLRRVGDKKRARLVAVGLAGSLGAVLAAVQFAKLTGILTAAAPVVADISARAGAAGVSATFVPQLLAAAAIAIAFAATAIVLQNET